MVPTDSAPAAEKLEPTPQQAADNGEIESGTQSPVEPSEIGEMFESMDQLPPAIKRGEVVQCKVHKVTDTEVFVDLGLKSEAALPVSEFTNEQGEVTVKSGDVVDVLIESYDEEEDAVVASHQKAAHMRVWEDIERAYRDKMNVTGRVIERTKGGLEVDVGVKAFLPASQADMRPLRNLDSLIGTEIQCKVANLDRKRNNVVVSRKAALEEEFTRQRQDLMAKLQEGAVLQGRVKNLVDYGAFVDLGGMDGLLHVTDLSWGRVSHPSEVVQVGQEVTVKVLKYLPEKERVSLGMKQLQPDPWEDVSGHFSVGDRIFGRVVSVTDYGAFVELAPGIEGLIHISEMTWSKRLKHPSKVVNVSDRVEVVVLDLNPAQKRISLSLRQGLPDPWSTLGDRVGVGAVVQGRVRNLTDFGAFVEVEEGVDGLIHLSDLSWTKRVKHPSEVLKKGQTVEAVVLALDPQNRRLSLGLKQLQPDVWDTFFAKTQVGEIRRGKVVRTAPFGSFVELEEGVEGLCHISEMEEFTAGSQNQPKLGSELLFRVIRLNPAEKRIGLSLNGVEQGQTPEPEPDITPSKASGNVTGAEAESEGSN
jgi:small subunit ribosomal protein S1